MAVGMALKLLHELHLSMVGTSGEIKSASRAWLSVEIEPLISSKLNAAKYQITRSTLTQSASGAKTPLADMFYSSRDQHVDAFHASSNDGPE